MASQVKPSLPPAEPKAKRTHARRSCGICKLRKSRCELPDLDVPSGPDPLPVEKSCHRCKVLSLPCIVDDSNRKQRKRKDDGAGGGESSRAGTGGSREASQSGRSSPKRRNSRAVPVRTASTDTSGPGGVNGGPAVDVDHTLDVLNGLSPIDHTPGIDPVLASFRDMRRDTYAQDIHRESGKSKSIKLHGRPLELTSAMLRMAYGRSTKKGRRVRVEDDDMDLNVLIDDTMKARLQPGVSQLRTYHPHLDTLAAMFDDYNKAPECSIGLLIATVAYLASVCLPADPSIQQLRNDLTPYVYQRRDTLLLHTPHTFFALHAIELFITHCPFGVLPLQPCNLQNLAVARGLTAVAKDIFQALNYQTLIESILSGPGVHYVFSCSDIWLWVALNAAEAAAMLEESNPQKPPHLAQARAVTDEFFRLQDDQSVWQNAIGQEDIAVLVGRLALCDKIARLEEVLDGMSRIRQVLELCASEPGVDPVAGILSEFEEYTRRTDELDKRHEVMMNMLREYSRNAESGWVHYRAIRRRYEFSKIHVTGLRALMATHYLPGSPYAYPDLPTTLIPTQAVVYAVTRACNPPDIVRFISDTSSTGGATPAVQAVWDWGRRRGVNMERNLSACSELATTLVSDLQGLIYSCIVPLHEAICIAVESAKVLMEMEAGTIHILRASGQLYKVFRPRSWLLAMNHFSKTLHNVSKLVTDDGLGGETVANGASNLIGSMVRTAEEWTRSLEKEAVQQEAAMAAEMTAQAEAAQRQQYAAANPGAQASYEAQAQGQHYMDTSDRWMAGNEPTAGTAAGGSGDRSQSSDSSRATPAPVFLQHPQGPQGPQQPPYSHSTALDSLLSEMFGYSYNPGTPQQQQQQPQPGQQAQAAQQQMQPPVGQMLPQHPPQIQVQLPVPGMPQGSRESGSWAPEGCGYV
ncbi:hypothetical protein IAT38_001410 [Cryptococcus sp. DSM 104549]